MMEVKRIHFKEIDSTNTWAKAHADDFDPKQLTCITAEIQTEGRGRYPGRKWISKKGNLHMSLFLAMVPDPNLGQILALSAAEVIREKGIFVQIKWPNDLICEGKKMSGCIVETTPQGVVMGIGINVNQNMEADQPTTTLRELSGKEWSTQELAGEITQQFLKNWELGFSALAEKLHHYLAYKGEWIACTTGRETIEGICLGISKKGYLQIQKKDGKITEILSGEIHRLRKV